MGRVILATKESSVLGISRCGFIDEESGRSNGQQTVKYLLSEASKKKLRKRQKFLKRQDTVIDRNFFRLRVENDITKCVLSVGYN